MIGINDMVGALARNVMVIKLQAEGLSHADSLLQLPFRGNCLNWVVGHIITSRDDMLELLGQAPLFGDSGPYRRGSEGITSEHPGVLRLDELLDLLDRSQAILSGALQSAVEADLEREMQSGSRTMTIGQRLFFLYFHETYHTGQTEIFRQLAGKDDAIIK